MRQHLLLHASESLRRECLRKNATLATVYVLIDGRLDAPDSRDCGEDTVVVRFPESVFSGIAIDILKSGSCVEDDAIGRDSHDGAYLRISIAE